MRRVKKEENAVEGEKNKGPRKNLFKGVPIGGGTTKMRMVQALISPRKRLPGKVTTKQGEGKKHGAEQGTSNPKPPTTKN